MLACLRHLGDEYLLQVGCVIHDPGVGHRRTLTTRNGRTHDIDPACQCCPTHEHPNYRRLKEAA